MRVVSTLLSGALLAATLAGAVPATISSAGACDSIAPRGTGDLGVVVERAIGRLQLVETTGRTALATIAGLGDLSHASVVFSRDSRHAASTDMNGS